MCLRKSDRLSAGLPRPMLRSGAARDLDLELADALNRSMAPSVEDRYEAALPLIERDPALRDAGFETESYRAIRCALHRRARAPEHGSACSGERQRDASP